MKLRVNGIGMPPPTDGAIRELVQVLKFRWILRVPRDQMHEQLNPVHRLSPSLWVGMTCSRSHVATQARHPVLDVEHSSEPRAMVSWFRSSRCATRSRSRQIPDNFTGWNIQPDSVCWCTPSRRKRQSAFRPMSRTKAQPGGRTDGMFRTTGMGRAPAGSMWRRRKRGLTGERQHRSCRTASTAPP